MKVGILGGTFDPPHIGHTKVAEQARRQLDLGVVLFIPAGQPWMKTGTRITAAEHRMAMLQLAIGDNSPFEVSDIEIKRIGPSYSIDTLDELTKSRKSLEMTFIMGEDAMGDLHRWNDVDRLLGMCDIAVYRRGKGRDWRERDLVLPGLGGSRWAIPLEGLPIEVSSSDVRRRAALGLSLAGLVHPSVETYITQKGLYASK